MNGLFALTPCVSLSRRAGEGERAAPLSHIVGEGLGVRAEMRARPANSEPERCTLTPCADKGTSVRHRIAAAGAIFPSGCVGRQARRVALTPCVPLSRGAGEGDCEVRKRSFRTPNRSARGSPLPRCGRGAGGEGEKARLFPTQRTQVLYPYQHPLCPPFPQGGRGGTRGSPLPRSGRGAGGEGCTKRDTV